LSREKIGDILHRLRRGKFDICVGEKRIARETTQKIKAEPSRTGEENKDRMQGDSMRGRKKKNVGCRMSMRVARR